MTKNAEHILKNGFVPILATEKQVHHREGQRSGDRNKEVNDFRKIF